MSQSSDTPPPRSPAAGGAEPEAAPSKPDIPTPQALAAEELAVKAEELRVRRLETQKTLVNANSPWWRRADPLVLAILAAALSLLGNMVAALVGNHYALQQETTKAAADLNLEQTKARYNLVLQAMATGDVKAASRNIHFFVDAGLLPDADCRVRNAIDHDQPVLPSLSAQLPPPAPSFHSAPEIAKLYDFPENLDGHGVTVAILEFGGKIETADVAAYFKSLGLPAPDLASVSMNGGLPAQPDADFQVMNDIEILGAIAPAAKIRVYFGQFSGQGYADAISRAVADGADVIETGYGQAESAWRPAEMALIDGALKRAGVQGVTVIAASGDGGTTDRVADGRPHVDFPASSPYVLAVGGTTLHAVDGAIASETAWRESENGLPWPVSTGYGSSAVFPRPSWQSGSTIPRLPDGGTGRAIPDVAASADPRIGVNIVAHGNQSVIGGTSVAVPIWAGLVARIDQALGYRIGLIAPAIYQSLGPAGAFHTEPDGDTAHSSGALGWNAVTGWGSPDGVKLLEWFRAHPVAQAPALAGTAAAACVPSPVAASVP